MTPLATNPVGANVSSQFTFNTNIDPSIALQNCMLAIYFNYPQAIILDIDVLFTGLDWKVYVYYYTNDNSKAILTIFDNLNTF